jgi:hypothetical protein
MSLSPPRAVLKMGFWVLSGRQCPPLLGKELRHCMWSIGKNTVSLRRAVSSYGKVPEAVRNPLLKRSLLTEEDPF